MRLDYSGRVSSKQITHFFLYHSPMLVGPMSASRDRYVFVGKGCQGKAILSLLKDYLQGAMELWGVLLHLRRESAVKHVLPPNERLAYCDIVQDKHRGVATHLMHQRL